MSADKILVLVNGKRRHRSALVQLSGDGVHGPDLATIPSIALKSVEVLRDGASAMYGSDAIAGVFNFNLRDSAEGGEVRLQTGMYTEGLARAVLSISVRNCRTTNRPAAGRFSLHPGDSQPWRSRRSPDFSITTSIPPRRISSASARMR
jgi:outer membrane receptor protein involved in Fe transport